MYPSVVEVRDLKKYFEVARPLFEQLFAPFAAKQKVCALKGVSFSIEAGEILGVVGPNGAGKTTLLRILADLLEADAGLIAFFGRRLSKIDFHLRIKIGFVPSDERSFFWRLTGKENLDFFGRLYGLSNKEIQRRSSEILREIGFERRAGELFRDYSGGMRKKIASNFGIWNEVADGQLAGGNFYFGFDSPCVFDVRDNLVQYINRCQERRSNQLGIFQSVFVTCRHYVSC